MPEYKGSCQAVVRVKQITKALITWQRSPDLPQEQCWLNVLDEYREGKIYRITIEEETP